MTRKAASFNGFRRAAPVAAVFSLTLASIALLNPERLVADRFERALAGSLPATAMTVAATREVASPAFPNSLATPMKSTPVAGSEAYWLGSNSRTANAPAPVEKVTWTAPARPGDRFTLSAGREAQAMVVTQVRELPTLNATVTPTESPSTEIPAPATPQWIVSFRQLADPDAPLLHLIVDGTAGLPWTRHTPDRAL